MNIAVILCLTSIFAGSLAERIVCYYGSWSVYRHGPAKFEVENINPKLCTHLIFSFVGLNLDGTVKILDPWNDVGDQWHEGAFTKLQRLRHQNPKLKIMSAIGGWNEGSTKYSEVVNDPVKRKVLVNSILSFVINYKFDGFDLDWEYPAERGGKPSDREAFSALIAELKEVFQKRGLILSAAVSGNVLKIPTSYDCKALAKYLDFINVLSYDLHGSWEVFTGHHTALNPHPKDLPSERHLNVRAPVEYWVNCSGAPDKIHIGIAFYGRTFTLANPSDHGVRAPAIGPGPPGKYIQEPGFLPYNEICLDQTQGLWNVYEIPEQSVKYAVRNNVWVGYDDPESITKKLEFAKSLKLGGAMIWSIDTDDFRGDCGRGKYPLLTRINNYFGPHNQRPEPSSSRPPVEESPTDSPPLSTSTSTPDKDSDSLCEFCGQTIKHPTNPSWFYMCTYSDNTSKLKAVLKKCPAGLIFDDDLKVCIYP